MSLHLGTVTETARVTDIISFEADGHYSRDTGTLASGQNLAAGTVLGQLTADDNYTQLDPVAADGSETAVAILLEAVDASGGALPCVVLKGVSIAKDQNLVWPGGITGPQKTTAIKNLFSQSQIKVKTGN